ncbi:MAG: PRC-barrel domain-containing protein [Anaerolineales bacterium]|jgi:uncharacterized protein YrrD
MEQNKYNLQIGTQVHCKDGRCGKLRKVVVDPDTQRIIELIVEKGFLLKEDRVVPIKSVEKTTEDNIHISIGSTELDTLRNYDEKEFMLPSDDFQANENNKIYAPGEMVVLTRERRVTRKPEPTVRLKLHEGISPSHTPIREDTRVTSLDGYIGKVSQVFINKQTQEIEQFVIEDKQLSHPVIVPMSMVDKVSEEEIHLETTKKVIGQLPRYQ